MIYYLIIIGFFIGIGVATVSPVSQEAIILVAVLGILSTLIAKRHQSVSSAKVLLIGLLLLAFSIGLFRTEIYSKKFDDSVFDTALNEETILSGRVVKEPDWRESSTHLYIEHQDELLLVIVDSHYDISYGDEVLIKGEITKPEAFETDFGRTFDYPGYLLAKGVTHQIRYGEIAVVYENKGNLLITNLLNIKNQLVNGIESVLSEPEAGLAKGLLLGLKQSLGDDLEELFRKAGITHIIVLSGYNLMLVVAFVMTTLSVFFGARIRAIIGIMAIISFALLVGLSATVVRASIMAGLVLFSGLISRSYNVYRALFFAGAVMVFINPYVLIYDIGFQLSFMATLGLLLIVPQFELLLSKTKEGTLKMKEYFMATVATQIAVLPLLLYHIGEVSLVAVPVNLLVLPMVPVAMFMAFVSGMVALVYEPFSEPLALATELSLIYIIKIAVWFGSLPFSTFSLPAFSWWWIFILYSLGVGLWYIFKNQNWIRKDPFSDWTIIEEEK